MTQSSIQALLILRKIETLKWYVLPLFVFVLYVYLNESQQKNFSIIILSIYSFFLEIIVEICNSLILHFTNYAPLWTMPDKTAYLIYAGYNIEIATFFAISGILFIKSLSDDKNKKILMIPNRIFYSILWGICAFIVEFILFKAKILVWEYSWWIFFVGPIYMITRLRLSFMYDNYSIKKQIIYMFIAIILAFIIHMIFAVLLKWV